MLSPVSPTQKPTCPCDGSDPRENTATAPSRPSAIGSPHVRYERAISDRVLAHLRPLEARARRTPRTRRPRRC